MMIMIYFFLVAASSFLVTISLADEGKFNYDRSDPDFGPDAWAKNFPEQCAGLRNSPINLDTVGSSSKQSPGWMLKGWNGRHMYDVEDKKITIQWNLLDGKRARPITTRERNSGKTYKLVQFHLHWGSDDTKGGEHTVNGQKYPMELHFVHMRSDFTNIGAAVASGDSDALGVLGFFFSITPKDNPAVKPLMEGARRVRCCNFPNLCQNNIGRYWRKQPFRRASGGRLPQCSADGKAERFSIASLMRMVGPQIKGNYMRYFGGLTTPACNEIVQWTVFLNPIGISSRQMNELRNGNPEAVGGDYFRDPQPLNGRTVIKFTT